MFEKVKEVILDTLSCEPEQITMEASLVDDLEADSLDAVELNLALNDVLGFSLTDEELKSIVTVGDIVRLLEEHHLRLYRAGAGGGQPAPATGEGDRPRFGCPGDPGHPGGPWSGCAPARSGGGGADPERPPGGHLLRRPRPGGGPLCQSGRPGAEGTDRLCAGSHEDDERGPRSGGLHH